MVRLEGKPGGSLVTREEFLKLLTDFHNRLVDTERTSDRHDDAITEMQARMTKFESFFMEELHNIEENLKKFRIFMNRADQMFDSMPDRTEMEEIETRFDQMDEQIKRKTLNDMDFREETRKVHANFEYQLGVIREDLEKLGVDYDPQYSSDGESQSDREQDDDLPPGPGDDDEFAPPEPFEP
jgi:hypothetical protein